jgi:hypothetical protein
MPKNSNPMKPQIDRFRETARALGADEDEAAFKAKLAVIGQHSPKPGVATSLSKQQAQRSDKQAAKGADKARPRGKP